MPKAKRVPLLMDDRAPDITLGIARRGNADGAEAVVGGCDADIGRAVCFEVPDVRRADRSRTARAGGEPPEVSTIARNAALDDDVRLGRIGGHCELDVREVRPERVACGEYR